MTSNQRILVLDANIMIRAALGKYVNPLIVKHSQDVHFVAPDCAFLDASNYIPKILEKHRLNPLIALERFRLTTEGISIADRHVYEALRDESLERIGGRDPDDWPVLATALALDCPIWTEDLDFFGTGIATWTTDRVHLYLESAERKSESAGR